MIIVHAVLEKLWESNSNNEFYGEDSLQKYGFIHCSEFETILDVANSNFTEFGQMLLLMIDSEKINAAVKWEDLRSCGIKFPHIYGLLNKDAIIEIAAFNKDENNTFYLPYETQKYRNINEIELIFPSKTHESAAAEYFQEHILNGENTLHGDSGLDSAENYDKWLSVIDKALIGDINSIIFFAFRKSDNKLIGTINIRYPYEGYIKIFGHIGYGVRPSERKKGYGTMILRLALEYCKKIGLEKVLLTCDKSNIASSKTIMKCSGVFESETLEENGDFHQRYWIDLSQKQIMEGVYEKY